MKVDVTLTLDDFLASQEGRLRPREMKAPISLLLGFLLIAIGYAALRWADPCDPGCGSSLGPKALAFGFLATVAGAPIELLLRFLWSRRQAKKQRFALESEFRRFYAEPRVLEADESGWRIRTGSAENLRQWADLAAMSEGRGIMTLTDLSASYPLPKSAFQGNELESLRRLCQQALSPASPLFSVSVVPTPTDYSSAMAAHNWNKRRGTMLPRYAAGMACASFVALVVGDAWPGFGLPSLLLLLLLMPVFERGYHQLRFSEYRPRAFQTAAVGADCVCLDTGSPQATVEMHRVRYRWISEVKETRRVLMLYVRPSLFYLVPKAGLQHNELSQLRELARQHGQTRMRNDGAPGGSS